MKHADLGDSAIGRLELALRSGTLPQEAERRGARLLERLRAPVGVVVLGPRGTGKTSLVNMLAGTEVIPETCDVAELELCWGPDEKTVLTQDDGTVETLEGVVLENCTNRSVRVEMPLPIFGQVKLFDVRVDLEAEDPLEQILWAVAQADILLWCSQSFSQEEQAIWALVPDEMKDHAFFVLTGADLLASEGLLEAHLAECSEFAGPEFHSLLPVATAHALAALGPDGIENERQWQSSGAATLVSMILKHAETGRRADLDSVLMFLNRYGLSEMVEAEGPAFAAAPAAARTPEPAPEPEPAPTAEDTVAPASPEAATDADQPRLDALAHLVKRAAALAELLNLPAEVMSAEVVSHCIETAEAIAAMLSTAEDSTARMADTAMEMAEMLVLYQIEGHAAADDALRLLLQLRRDLEQAPQT